MLISVINTIKQSLVLVPNCQVYCHPWISIQNEIFSWHAKISPQAEISLVKSPGLSRGCVWWIDGSATMVCLTTEAENHFLYTLFYELGLWQFNSEIISPFHLILLSFVVKFLCHNVSMMTNFLWNVHKYTVAKLPVSRWHFIYRLSW